MDGLVTKGKPFLETLDGRFVVKDGSRNRIAREMKSAG